MSRIKAALLAVSLVMVTVFAAACYCFMLPAPPPMGPGTVCTVYEYKPGRRFQEIPEIALAANDPPFQAVMNYFNAPSTRSGWWSLVSYAPGLVVSTDTIKVNIHRQSIVVCTRDSADETWRQAVRSKTAEDFEIERVVRAHLKASHKERTTP